MTVASAADSGADEAGSAPTIDGRRARRDANRERVVDAMLDLYREGEPAPSISRVARRSGLSYRSVFRYFEDLDQLCRVAIERHAASMVHLLEIENFRHGSLDDRIKALIRCRVELYEAVAPVARVIRMRAPLQPVLDERLEADRRRLDRQVAEQFAPEIDALGDEEQMAVSRGVQVLCSLDSMELMRHSQGLSRSETIVTLTAALSRILDADRNRS